MNYSEENFEALIRLRDALSGELSGDAELNEELHEAAIEQFGKATVQEAIDAWNSAMLDGREQAYKNIREVLGMN